MKMNYFKIWGLVLFTVLCINTESMATDCTPTPDCTTLGYTKTASDCSGADIILKCPTDTSKVACSAVTVTYEPKVGYILYSDKTFSPNVEAGKIAIGVIFDEANRLAIALDETNLYWSTERIDIPALGSCGDEPFSCSINGKQNTAAIMEYVKTNGKTGKYSAAEYCASYRPSTVYQDDWCAEGQWFLPSMRELKTLYNNKAVVNASLQKVNAVTLSSKSSYYWSSTEYSYDYAWVLYMFNAGQNGFGKSTYDYNVRPVIAF